MLDVIIDLTHNMPEIGRYALCFKNMKLQDDHMGWQRTIHLVRIKKSFILFNKGVYFFQFFAWF